MVNSDDHGAAAEEDDAMGNVAIAQGNEEDGEGGREIARSWPLLAMQSAYYVGRHAENGGDAYLYFEVDLPEVDRGRLESAWRRVALHHDSLRLRVSDDGRQRFSLDAPHEFNTQDLRGLSLPEQSEALIAIRRSLAEDRFPRHDPPAVDLRVSLLSDRSVRLHFRLSLLCVDGYGLAVLLGELADLYANPAASLPRQQAFSAAIAAMQVPDPRRDAAKAWWCNRLSELPGPPELPLLARRPSDSPLCRRRLELAPTAWHDFCHRAGVLGLTPSMAVCSVLADVVATFSETSRFLLGVMMSSRPSSGKFDGVVGNLSTLALLPVEAPPDAAFEERALSLQREFMSSMEHSAFGGLEVLSELNRRQKRAMAVGAPVVFSSNLHLPRSTPCGDSFGPFAVYGSQWAYSALQTPQVLLDVSISTGPDGALVAHWDAREAVFPPGLIDDMAATFLSALSRLAENQEAWKTALPLTPEEQLARRASVNATGGPLGRGGLHEPFYVGLDKHKGCTAVVAADLVLSYAWLAGLAQSIGDDVRRHGVGRNKLVAVVLDKGWEQIAAVFGILSAGAAYVPIDPSLPTERRSFLLRTTEASLVVTSNFLDKQLDWPSNVPRSVVSSSSIGANALTGVTRGPADPNDLAYVIFTSGSTGIPKGVMIDHRAAANTVRDINERFQVGARDRVLGVSALNFDLSVWDIFGMLGAGGALVLPDPDRLVDPAHWLDLIETHGVTIWNSAPPVMVLLVDYLESVGRTIPHTLRLVLLSGDWIPTTLPNRIRALAAPEIQIVSLGGATEAAIWSVVYPIADVKPDWRSIPYGKPLRNQALHVLDVSLRPRPDWVPGEIYIGGTGVARGYWNDTAKTDSSFIVNPATGERLYRTGDYGRYLPDGNIEFLGRRDNQVKLRGYRVELGEIESLLLSHSEVSSVAAGVRTQGGDQLLVAYCVPSGIAITETLEGRLRDMAAQQLPSYMVPQAIFLIRELPLSSNGKVDRGALSRLPFKASKCWADGPATSKMNETETVLAGLMASAIGREIVGPEENFFELGGQSFAAVRLMSQVRQVFGVELPISALLREPTARGLALHLGNRGSAAQRIVPMRSGGDATPVLLVHAAGGNVLGYQELSRSLGPGIPLFAFEARGLVEGEVPHERIEAMAAEYAESVMSLFPEGPIILGGWSSGGVVAFEMAHQLISRGIEVTHLVLIDSPCPLDRKTVSDRLAVEWFLTDLYGGRPPPRGQGQSVPPFERLASAIRARMREGGTKASTANDHRRIELAFEVFRASLNALRSYEPAPLDVPTVIFKASGPPIAEFLSHPALQDEGWGWDPWLVDSVECIQLLGNHYQVLEGRAARSIAEVLTGLAQGASKEKPPALGAHPVQQHSALQA